MISTQIILESGLECYYCHSDDHQKLEECNAEHPGGIVKCQTEDSDAPHYGTFCSVGHTGMFFFETIKLEAVIC